MKLSGAVATLNSGINVNDADAVDFGSYVEKAVRFDVE
jgi:hypothetical protein